MAYRVRHALRAASAATIGAAWGCSSAGVRAADGPPLPQLPTPLQSPETAVAPHLPAGASAAASTPLPGTTAGPLHDTGGLGAAALAPSPAAAGGLPAASDPTVFFATSTPPPHAHASRKRMEAFVAAHVAGGRKVAVVTSGGTAVPLERNTVRFLDNFSTGTRGARCTEALLKEGYAVILLRREGSVRPFHIATSAWAHNLPAALTPAAATAAAMGSASPSGVDLYLPDIVREEVAASAAVQREDALLEVPFVSVSDYLHLLRHASQAAAAAGDRVMLLLAAAVSDFYVPESRMVEHKIQSKGGSSKLVLELDGVPKLLGLLRHEWAADAFVVSFKLETDDKLLMAKAHKALDTYGMNCVVANLLPKRYEEVHIVDVKSKETVAVDPTVGGIEAKFVQRLVARHDDLRSRE